MDVRGLATSDEVAAAADAARASGRLGIDTEFMSEGRYRALLCVVNVSNVSGSSFPEGSAILERRIV